MPVRVTAPLMRPEHGHPGSAGLRLSRPLTSGYRLIAGEETGMAAHHNPDVSSPDGTPRFRTVAHQVAATPPPSIT